MFIHAPLLEPTKQFRLLSFDGSSTATHLRCRLETFELATCPDYHALSYVYGDPLLREPILVNGEISDLNRNGWHALQQARLRASAGAYYWLDALCINQTDLPEKAVQVYKIAEIFTGATEVWAHFGLEQDDSDFLFQALASFPPEDCSLPVVTSLEYRSDDLQRRTVNWLASLGEDFDRFACAMKAFGHRPFFSRTWIYQELYLASRVIMTCGTAIADMQALRDISLVCTTLYMSHRPDSDYDYKQAQVTVLNKMEKADMFIQKPDRNLHKLEMMVHQVHRKDPAVKTLHYEGVSGLVDIQVAIQNLQCYDARDKIFAVISLLGSAYGIMPDYTISCFDLASQVLAQHSYKDSDQTDSRPLELAALLCVNLRLCPDVVEVKDALAKNILSTGYSSFPEYLPGAPMLWYSTTWACQVSLSSSGKLTAPMITYKSESWTGVQPPLAMEQIAAPFEPVRNKSLYVENCVVAIAACELFAGDWVIPMSDYSTDLGFETYCYGVILRAQGPEMYRIAGEISFKPYCRLCSACSWETERCECALDPQYHPDSYNAFNIAFDSEELLLLSIRLRKPFETMRHESRYRSRAPPLLPPGPPMEWPSSFAVKRRESCDGVDSDSETSGTSCTEESDAL
ncbi:hypothetical protein Q7P35_008048 [Cladosporium inversicolor]